MKMTTRTLAAAALVALGLAACSKKLSDNSEAPPAQAPAASGEQTAAPLGAPAPAGTAMTGKVLETMDAASYTYVQVDLGDRKIWAAAPKFEVKVGDTVSVPEGMPMENYHSETLNRDFELVYFVGAIGVGGQPPAMGDAGVPGAAGVLAPQAEGLSQPLPDGLHPQVDPAQAAKDAKVDFAGLKKADKTVGEVFANPAALSGKEVAIRGKVVKFNAQIMGKNWIHVQDGTGEAGGNDLTVTTGGLAEIGDTVVVRGKITLDKDFGMGYRYSVIIEDAAVTVE